MKVYDAQQLWSEEIPKLPFVLSGGLLPERGIMIITGDPGVGKSFLAIKLASEVSAGLPPLGILRPSKRRVLFISLEMAGPGFRQRVKSLLHPDSDFTIIEASGMDLDSPNSLSSLATDIKMHGAEVVIIDALAEALTDETQIVPMKQLTRNLRSISLGLGTTFILVQHLRKRIESRTGGLAPVTLSHIRGSSQLQYAIDLAVLVEEPEISLSQVGRRTISILKTRYSGLRTLRPIHFDFEIFEDGEGKDIVFELPRQVCELCQYLWKKKEPVERNIAEKELGFYLSEVLDEAKERGLLDIGLIRLSKSSPQKIWIVGGRSEAEAMEASHIAKG